MINSSKHPARKDSSPIWGRPKNAKSIGTKFALIALAATLSACGDDWTGESADSASNQADSAVVTTAGSPGPGAGSGAPPADAENQNTVVTSTPVAGEPPASDVVTTVTSAKTINSVQTIVDDMGLSNDAPLLGIPDFQWAVNVNPGQLSMGADPRGCIAHAWWQNATAVRPEYKDCDYWTGYVQWFVVFEGVGNNANNVRVESRNPQSWYLSKSTGQWKLMGEAAGTGWFNATKTNVMWVPGQLDIYTGEGGSTVMKVDRNHPYSYHGIWPQNKIDISAYVHDIAAVYTTVQARLVVDNPNLPDDRNQAIWLFQSGADYYPYPGASASDSLPPGVGLSRSKKITSEWQSFNFATLNNARRDYSGPVEPLSTAQLFQNPPPLQ